MSVGGERSKTPGNLAEFLVRSSSSAVACRRWARLWEMNPPIHAASAGTHPCRGVLENCESHTQDKDATAKLGGESELTSTDPLRWTMKATKSPDGRINEKPRTNGKDHESQDSLGHETPTGHLDRNGEFSHC